MNFKAQFLCKEIELTQKQNQRLKIERSSINDVIHIVTQFPFVEYYEVSQAYCNPRGCSP